MEIHKDEKPCKCTHTAENPNKCNVCDSSFSDSEMLFEGVIGQPKSSSKKTKKNRNKKEAKGKKTHENTFEICELFSDLTTKTHVKKVEKTFACSECGSSFKMVHKLLDHKSTHKKGMKFCTVQCVDFNVNVNKGLKLMSVHTRKERATNVHNVIL